MTKNPKEKSQFKEHFASQGFREFKWDEIRFGFGEEKTSDELDEVFEYPKKTRKIGNCSIGDLHYALTVVGTLEENEQQFLVIVQSQRSEEIVNGFRMGFGDYVYRLYLLSEESYHEIGDVWCDFNAVLRAEPLLENYI